MIHIVIIQITLILGTTQDLGTKMRYLTSRIKSTVKFLCKSHTENAVYIGKNNGLHEMQNIYRLLPLKINR